MRTIVNMVDRLGEKFDFRIVTRDHDGPDKVSYTSVKLNAWNSVGKAKVYYPDKNRFSLRTFRKLIAEVSPHAIYLNSFFSLPTIYALLLRKLSLINDIPIIVAPCGELSSGALSLKPWKKKSFQLLSRVIGLYKNLIWKASSDIERAEIKSCVSGANTIFVAPDLAPVSILPFYKQGDKPEKVIGRLKIVFMSRISHKKNLKFFLEVLKETSVEGSEIEFDIIGPVVDERYWIECRNQISNLSESIKVNYLGNIPNDKLIEKLVSYHLFVLPTIGENFGHVFIEAFSAGLPILISDKTPWLDLAKKGIGCDIPLTSKKDWVDKLNYYIKMDNDSYSTTSSMARRFGVDWLDKRETEYATERVLRFALNISLKKDSDKL